MSEIIKMFTINEEGLVDYSPPLLAIKEFRALRDRDKSPTKRRAVLELSAIYFMGTMAPDNPFRDYPKESKIEEIHEQILKGEEPMDFYEDELVRNALVKMVDIDKTSIARKALRTAINATNKLDTYLNEVDLLAFGDDGKPIHDAKKFQEIIRNNANLAKSLLELEKAVAEEELGSNNRVRGGAKDELDL